ncbi:hypothetical protein B0I35DRAFT_441065 [Stachybotrys elegans]|uniref:Uncharacterized protein n=1 Tax=Stachybotrys elegans TaxID=80388 RepID=A0A8K0WN62_9HYPO|nr:hypothetical protein B0I35DRAFT_441065 [Stachybotrys elegans]
MPRPTFVSSNVQGAFLGKAGLLDVKELRSIQVDDRCIGMRIDYHDGTIGTLGQWDPSKASEASLIYKSCDGPLLGLIFLFSDSTEPFKRYVRSVSIGHAPQEAVDNSFFWDDFNSELAWWFTFRYDYVEKWEGDALVLDMPRTDLLPVEVK